MSLLAMEGLVAVITGAGSGIGLATLEAMRAEGARVAALDLRPPPAREGVLPLSCDVTDQASVDKAVAAAAQHFGGIDILVNNAGIGAQGNVEENALDEWQRVFDVNVFGMVRLARACLPHLRKSRSPAIVNVASIVSWTGLPKRACYGASKGAVYALTLAMAADHAGEGIRVNCVCPGTVDTPWVGRLLSAAPDPTAARAGPGRAPADRPARHRRGDRGGDHLSRLARGGLHDRQRAADRRRHPRHRGAAGSSALVKIRGLRALDVRCPTSRFLDGSDAVHGDPDYSAAYVILEADSASGHGMTFTIGRGTEVVCAAVHALAHRVVGRELEEITADFAAFHRSLTNESQLRWLGPDKGVIHLATAAIVNAVWDLWAKRAASRCGSSSPISRRASSSALVDWRYLSDALSADQALDLLRARGAGQGGARGRAAPRRLSRVHHVGGLARLSRGQGAPPVPRVDRRRLDAASRPRSASTSPPTCAGVR